MSNYKVISGVILILLAAASLVIYKNFWPNGANGPKTAISFDCEEFPDFIAEFDAEFKTLKIIENGEVVRELQSTQDAGIRFANEDYTYLFAGEEVKVTDLDTNYSAVCSQPMDPNNAPYNFGDAAEGAGENQDVVAAVNSNIIGVWKSLDDAKFIREFRPDGTVVDRYESSDDVTGIWNVFTSEAFPSPVNFPLESGMIYLRISTGEGQENNLHFKLNKLTPEELEMVYLEGNETLKFKMVEQVGS